jgi:hypothetical protein
VNTSSAVDWAGRDPRAQTWPVAYASRDDLFRFGRGNRQRVPRSAQAVLEPVADAVRLIRDQEATRIADLLPLRYERMLTSPFAFYRGSAVVMAADLAAGPRTDLVVQLCGDAHLSNFGLFASPERRLVFDLNDFDETYPGPFEWDVKRLAVSLEVAGRENGFSPRQRRALVLRGAASYRKAMLRFADLPSLAVWYAHLEVEKRLPLVTGMLTRAEYDEAAAVLARARRRDSQQAVKKLTRVVDGEIRLAHEPPLLVPITELMPRRDRDELMAWIAGLLGLYAETLSPDRRRLLQQYHLTDVGRRVVGVGSVGTAAWVALMTGADGTDPLVLQAKEAQPSVLEPWLERGLYEHQGERVVEGQRLLQAFGDVLLGWKSVDLPDGGTQEYYLRQFRDWKGSFETATMTPSGFGVYASMCGWTLARAHARSGDRVAIAAYLGRGDAFDRAIAAHAAAYADKNAADFGALGAAADRGLVTVAP